MEKNRPDKNAGRGAPPSYITLPIVQPDSRQKKTNVPLPDDENVERAKEWVDSNGLS